VGQTMTNANAAWLWVCALALVASGGGTALAQEQFVLVDSTFTATAQNTSLSQYGIAPLPAAPANWKTPVDWTKGSMHVRFEILEKPSNAKTLTNVCFENSNVLTCQPYPPPYSNTGVFQSDDRLPTFWQYNVYDWTQKLEHVYVVIKDENGKLAQGNAMFYPSKMRVTVTIVPPGKAYRDTAVSEKDDDGGMPTAPKPDAGAATKPAGSEGLGAASGAAGARTPGNTVIDAGPPRAGTGTGSAGLSTLQMQDAGSGHDIRAYIDNGNSCSALPQRAGREAPYALLAGFELALGVFATRRRRR
jgi:hypothetical protein